jgi:hypothetical protein
MAGHTLLRPGPELFRLLDACMTAPSARCARFRERSRAKAIELYEDDDVPVDWECEEPD